jgi:trehalose 6-phosphate synthase/phosphatase
MARIIIVSNRLPINIKKVKNNYEYQPSVGGVATGLNSLSETCEQIWIGWPGITKEKLKDDINEVENELISRNYYPVFLSKKQVEKYYNGFCNKTLWPLFHYFIQSADFSRRMWDCYKRVNIAFRDEVLKVAKKDDIIWVQDFHLFLLPQLLREKLPEAKIGFFLHIPFPSSEVFRLLPWREEILNGLLGADLIGVHTYDYTKHLLSSILRVLGHENEFGYIKIGDRKVKVDTFPMGIDYDHFANTAKKPEVEKEIETIKNQVGERKVILSIDRLDYTKGIPPRIEGFDIFLEQNPDFKEKVSLILVAVPSRTNVKQYKELKKQIEEQISNVNGKHGTIGWTPIWYFYRMLPFDTLVALYKFADIALITPLRDGMNLMAKEFIATKGNEKGVLILSEMAGAATELGEALIVNPNNKEDIARAINKALKMTCEEQRERNRAIQKRLKQYNITHWMKEFITKLTQETKLDIEKHVNILTPDIQKDLISKYSTSKDRLIILDYDGTLVPFADKPEDAEPNDKVINMLNKLASDNENEVIIVSGRDKKTLETWFSGLNINLIAEHGAWAKECNGHWEPVKGLRNDWKEEIRPILDKYVDRTPGSFIEEKDYSLVWHYRKADPRHSWVRALELKDALVQLTSNHKIEVLEGSKVIEVRNVGVNKGQSAVKWLNKNRWDYIMAIGDDVTDEDMFAALPKNAYSIKVGLKPSIAKYNLESVVDIHKLLDDLN